MKRIKKSIILLLAFLVFAVSSAFSSEGSGSISSNFDNIKFEIKKAVEQLDEKQGLENSDLNLQFQLEQYNALIESVTDITKALTEQMKSIAQRDN